MLYFHKNNDELGKIIEEKLKEMSAAFKTVEIQNKQSYLVEDEQVIQKKESILSYLESYGKLLNSHQLVTGDACYVDPETGLSCNI